MTKMRKWLDLYESYESSLYENFQSNVPGEFEESGWVYIESIEWEDMMEHDGLMSVYFAATHYNKEWTEAAKVGDRTGKYSDVRIPPFIDEDQLWLAIAKYLEAEGYKDLRAQFDIYGGTWYGAGISISVSNEIVAQGKSLLMKKRFKKKSVDEAMEDAFLDEDAFFMEAIPNEYMLKNPDVYKEWLARYNTGLQIDPFDLDTKSFIITDMNVALRKMKAKVKIIDIDYDFDILMGLYKIKYTPPKNFRIRK